ncbi:ABC transporter substrate-binding protein [Gracilinema caldarium]|uniref:ABC transporter substrate-binding protein n=1 Tax=Gracilinema caldarium TaxID=215591 RepID=UPI0026ED7037|nr:extracellular solute-binding protein [Gracilinema caldarium]
MKRSALFVSLFLVCALIGVPLFAQTQIRISGWPGNPDEEAAIKAMVDAFNAKNKDIVMVWEPTPGDYNQTLKTRLAGGTAADLFYLDVSAFEEFARSGNLLPLDSYLKDGTLKDFPQPLIDGFTFNSRIYGIAKDFSTLSVLYNKEIFDKAKVPYPKDGMTYSEFIKMLETLKAKGVANPMIINADFNRMIPFIIANGGRVTDDNMNIAFAEPKTKAAIQMYVNIYKKGLGVEASSVGAGWEGEAFGKEQVALIMSGPWCLGYLKGSFPNVYKKLGVVEMPRGTQKSTMIYTVSWSINKQTKNRAAAITALKFLVSEGQRIFVEKAGVLASNRTIAAQDKDPIKLPFYRGAEYGTAWRIKTPSGLFSRANDEINSRIKDAFYGKLSVDDLVKQVTENYDSWVE